MRINFIENYLNYIIFLKLKKQYFQIEIHFNFLKIIVIKTFLNFKISKILF
jgi:hypothetical protein